MNWYSTIVCSSMSAQDVWSRRSGQDVGQSSGQEAHHDLPTSTELFWWDFDDKYRLAHEAKKHRKRNIYIDWDGYGRDTEPRLIPVGAKNYDILDPPDFAALLANTPLELTEAILPSQTGQEVGDGSAHQRKKRFWWDWDDDEGARSSPHSSGQDVDQPALPQSSGQDVDQPALSQRSGQVADQPALHHRSSGYEEPVTSQRRSAGRRLGSWLLQLCSSCCRTSNAPKTNKTKR